MRGLLPTSIRHEPHSPTAVGPPTCSGSDVPGRCHVDRDRERFQLDYASPIHAAAAGSGSGPEGFFSKTTNR